MKLNEAPVTTSKNYGINNFEIPNEFLKFDVEKFDGFSIDNSDCCKILDFENQLEGNFLNKKIRSNFDKKVIVTKSFLKPVYLSFDLKHKNLVSNLLLEVEENVKTNIILELNSQEKCFHSGNLKIKLNKNSELNIVVVNFLNKNSLNLFNQESQLLENAKLNFKIVDFGCDYSVWANKAILNGNFANSNLETLYLGVDNNKLDYNFEQSIFGQNCKCEICSVGALTHESVKNFKGTITFNKGCKKSIGNESEFCFLLSNKAKSKALPMLLCYEEDISGNHSTAVGKIDKKELFYIMSRGFSKPEATSLIVKAKFAQVLNNLIDEELKEKVAKKIDERIKSE